MGTGARSNRCWHQRSTPTAEMWREGDRAAKLSTKLLESVKAADVLRSELEVGDLSLIFEQLAAIDVGDRERSMQLRRRYLAMLLEAMRNTSGEPLPGPPPKWEEISSRFATTQ